MTLKFKYLGKFKFISETNAEYELRDQMGSPDEKKTKIKTSC
jgi:hypothetical protein